MRFYAARAASRAHPVNSRAECVRTIKKKDHLKTREEESQLAPAAASTSIYFTHDEQLEPGEGSRPLQSHVTGC